MRGPGLLALNHYRKQQLPHDGVRGSVGASQLWGLCCVGLLSLRRVSCVISMSLRVSSKLHVCMVCILHPLFCTKPSS